MMKGLHAAFAVALALGIAPSAEAKPAPAGFEEKLGEAKAAMMADSAAALAAARQAASMVEGDDQDARIAKLTARWLEGEALMRLNRAAEAEELISEALQEVRAIAPDNKLHADLLRSKAGIMAMSGNYPGALESFQGAHALYRDLGEKRSEAIVLQNIGSLYSDAHDYERVLKYYQDATQAFPDDPALSLSAANNQGNALKELARYDEAEEAFGKALAEAEKMDSALLQARILTNIASTQYVSGKLGEASKTLDRATRIARRGAPEWMPFLYGVRAQVLAGYGRNVQARSLLERTFAGQDLARTPAHYRDFHKTGYEIYRALGEFKPASEHLAAFNRIDTQARDLSAKANNALLSARFEAADRELQITRLSAESQAQEAELAIANSRNILLTAGFVLALILILGALLVLRAVNRNRRAIAKANDQLLYSTQHDGLTKLYSRSYFRTLLDQQIEAARDGDPRALMLVDLDRFKQVNDIYGHPAGDELLVTVAQRFRAVVGKDGIVGRLGGDEFAIILPRVRNTSEASLIAEKIVKEVSEPYLIEGHDLFIGASIGIAMIGVDGDDHSILMSNADLALYEAKDRGRGMQVVFLPSMRRTVEKRSNLADDLAVALKRGEISIRYQPITRASDGAVACYEALMRWDHPERGTIGPDVFIPLAESCGLIQELGGWMLRTACMDAREWPEDTRLNVNVSTLQLSHCAFLNTVVDALAKSGLSPNRLVLELTESILLRMDGELERLLDSVEKLGVKFALDDFGRGYSSFDYLEKIDFAMIKIDREFVQAAASGSDRSLAIVGAIVTLAQSLGIAVTAEGIETREQHEALVKLGCNFLQGFHIGMPEAHRSAPLEELRASAMRA